MQASPAVAASSAFATPLHRSLLTFVLAAPLLAAPCLTPQAHAFLHRDEGGWSTFQPAADTQIIYVSQSTGDDANDGLTPQTAVASLNVGASLLRNDSADWLLLKSGDVWHESIDWQRRGRSAAEPIVVASYGEGNRPLIRSGSSSGITLWSRTFSRSYGYSNLVFADLHLQADDWTGSKSGNNPIGIRVDRPGENLLFENLKIEGYASNLVIQAMPEDPMGQNIQVRRSVLVDAFAQREPRSQGWKLADGTQDFGYEGGSHAQGLYASRIDGLLIEENVLDHNGWNEAVEGAERTIFNHNLYLQTDNTANTLVTGNIIARGASHGLQQRPGGMMTNNLFVANAIAGFLGTPTGVGGTARGNVFTEPSLDVVLAPWSNGSTGPRGTGLDMLDHDESAALYNLFLHGPDGAYPIEGLEGVETLGNIIYGWAPADDWDAALFPDGFPDPDRTLADYAATLGLEPSTLAFLAMARELSRDNWNEALTADAAIDFFHEGFGIHLPEPASVTLLMAGLLLTGRRRRSGN